MRCSLPGCRPDSRLKQFTFECGGSAIAEDEPGKGRCHAVEFIPARELPDFEYPLLLSTGRLLQHFHTGSMSRRSGVLDDIVPRGAIETHPQDAAKLGVCDGDLVTVESRRGQIEITALDPVAKIPEFKVCAVRVRSAATP